jgi:hypothetical protein
MGKKCIPGIICVENMTLFLLIVLIVFLLYFYHNQVLSKNPKQVIVVQQPLGDTGAMIPLLDGQEASLTPPINGIYMAPNQLPSVKVGPRSTGQYAQVGILTRSVKKNGEDLILPLMGRRTGRYDKMQYYTMSNTGAVNTKLPISKNGKSCTGEYGCDEINNGDTVYVEGYSDTFKVTVYESGQFSYDPNVYL